MFFAPVVHLIILWEAILVRINWIVSFVQYLVSYDSDSMGCPTCIWWKEFRAECIVMSIQLLRACFPAACIFWVHDLLCRPAITGITVGVLMVAMLSLEGKVGSSNLNSPKSPSSLHRTLPLEKKKRVCKSTSRWFRQRVYLQAANSCGYLHLWWINGGVRVLAELSTTLLMNR